MNLFWPFYNVMSTSLVRYALFAGFAWLLAYVLFRNRWFGRKVISQWPAASDMGREILYSIRTTAVYGVVGVVTLLAIRGGYTQLYRNFDDHGWPYFVLSIFLVICLHDTYFYWTHRLMHHPKLFKLTHWDHHKSKNPTPWASYAFSPIEAAVQAGIFPLAAFLLPLHFGAFAIFMLWQIGWNVIGHTGFEFFPRWWMTSGLGVVFNTPTHHVMHHERIHGNYGLYFNFWDRLMGTNHRQYQERFHQITHGEPLPPSAAPQPQPTPRPIPSPQLAASAAARPAKHEPARSTPT